ncbi:hypothetical protein PALS2_076 [Staphylococcus phage PALS_2]|nr:hypothetical protein PALS2_076 [Staphylococcus phage PALS_2]
MKYYKVNYNGILKILNLDDFEDDRIIETLSNIELYLKEDEEIRLLDLFKKPTIAMDTRITKEKDNLYMNGHLFLEVENASCKLWSYHINLNGDETLNEIYERIYNGYDKNFSFNKMREDGLLFLYEYEHYTEISEKEYKENKVKENFK